MQNTKSKLRVLISIPNTGWIHRNVAFAAMRLLLDPRVDGKVIMPVHNPYEHNMNRIAKDVVDGGYDFWINIDSDNPPVNNPIDLVFLNLDLVACPTPQWNNSKPGDRPVYWVAVDKCIHSKEDAYKEHTVKEGLQEVDAVGSGCIVAARRVLERIKRPFERIYDSNGFVVKGADFNFCDKVKAAGFQIWAHYGYPCNHFKEIEMNEMIRSFEGIHA